MHSEATRRTASFALIAAAAAAYAYAYAPLLSGWYFADDWHFLALYRHLDSPMRFVVDNPVTSYFYRPITLLLGWAWFQRLELNASADYVLSLALHAWVAIEIYRLALIGAACDDGPSAHSIQPAVSASKLAAFAIAVLFLLFPINAGTVAWISNRFDLMATAASLAAIRCAFMYANAPRAKPLIAMSIWASLACLSKESGFAAIPACALLVFAVPRFDWRARTVHAPLACLTLVVVGVFALRYIALGYLLPPTSDLPQPVGHVEGVLRWSKALAFTLQVHPVSALGIGALVVVCCLLVVRSGECSRSLKWLLGCVFAYAVLVIVAQAPIAKAAFPENAFHFCE